MIRRPPRSTRTDTLFPYTALFRSSYQHLRIVPVFAALLLVAASLPLLRYARDYPPTNKSWNASFRGAFAYLGGLANHLKARPNAAKFLLASMIYADGLTAISIFTGVLAGGVMGWSATELLQIGRAERRVGQECVSKCKSR